MIGHTKGPWSVHPGHYPGFLVVKGASFNISVVTTARDLDFNDFCARRADAHLIAAAPDLLEALERAAIQFRHYELSHREKGTDDSMRKAEVNADLAYDLEQVIAKAKGEAQ